MSETKNVTMEDVRAKQRELLEGFYEKFSKGKLTLRKPIKDGDMEYSELTFDFSKITGDDFFEALDADSKASSAMKLTAKQSLNLFAIACVKCADNANGKRLDKFDIIRDLDICDRIEALQVTETFFTAASRLGDLNFASI